MKNSLKDYRVRGGGKVVFNNDDHSKFQTPLRKSPGYGYCGKHKPTLFIVAMICILNAY